MYYVCLELKKTSFWDEKRINHHMFLKISGSKKTLLKMLLKISENYIFSENVKHKEHFCEICATQKFCITMDFYLMIYYIFLVEVAAVIFFSLLS